MAVPVLWIECWDKTNKIFEWCFDCWTLHSFINCDLNLKLKIKAFLCRIDGKKAMFKNYVTMFIFYVKHINCRYIRIWLWLELCINNVMSNWTEQPMNELQPSPTYTRYTRMTTGPMRHRDSLEWWAPPIASSSRKRRSIDFSIFLSFNNVHFFFVSALLILILNK